MALALGGLIICWFIRKRNHQEVIESGTNLCGRPQIQGCCTSDVSGSNLPSNTFQGTYVPASGTLNHSVSEVIERRRLNPPAYSPYLSPAPSPMPTDTTQFFRPVDQAPEDFPYREMDSAHRLGSSASGTSQEISSLDVMGMMGLTMPTSVTGSSRLDDYTVSTGQSGNIVTHWGGKARVRNPN